MCFSIVLDPYCIICVFVCLGCGGREIEKERELTLNDAEIGRNKQIINTE